MNYPKVKAEAEESKNHEKVELFAEAQPYAVIEKLNDYLRKQTTQVDDVYFFDDRKTAGLLRVEHEPLTGADGLKVNITIEIFARKENLTGLSRKIQENFGAFTKKF